MRSTIVALSLLLAPLAPARAQALFGIHYSGPAVSIGLELPVYPEFVQVPNEPVYYAPRVDANYFFFDGTYWVFRDDRWFASARYDGPWQLVAPEYVPAYVLRVPVRYYRQPPTYFHAWRHEEPPRWGERWGHDWERRHAGWERRDVPRPAAAPVYAGERRYPGPAAHERHEARPERGHDRSREANGRRGGDDDRGHGRGHGDGHGRGGDRDRDD